jgi:CheY-like chemotaxis protein
MPRKRILVVDDEEHIREIAIATLELTCGWETLSAACGREAVDIATRERPDAVLLDVMMPDMDGPTAFLLLRANARTSDIPVIFLTAKVQTADRQRYMSLGVSGVIAKPFDPMHLGQEIATLLDWQREASD